MSSENVKTEAPFTQVVVWPGTLLAPEEVAEFEEWMLSELKTRVKFLETIVTGPDIEDGHPDEGTGGRSDVFFAVHTDDIGHFAVLRFQFGMRWIEDVLGNELMQGRVSIYPARVRDYRTW